MTDKAFLIWKDKQIVFIKHLYIDGTFASFEQVIHEFNLQPTNFFGYLQIRDFVRKHFSSFPVIPPPILIDTILQINPHLKGTISVMVDGS